MKNTVEKKRRQTNKQANKSKRNTRKSFAFGFITSQTLCDTFVYCIKTSPKNRSTRLESDSIDTNNRSNDENGASKAQQIQLFPSAVCMCLCSWSIHNSLLIIFNEKKAKCPPLSPSLSLTVYLYVCVIRARCESHDLPFFLLLSFSLQFCCGYFGGIDLSKPN